MLTYRYPLIAREGWLWIAIIAVAAVILNVMYGTLSLPLWLCVLVLLYLFRDPMRKIPAVPLGIVSPVDGKVIAIDEVQDAYLNRSAIRISIKMKITSVYSAHSPIEGKVQEQWFGKASNVQDSNVNSSSKEIDTFAQYI